MQHNASVIELIDIIKTFPGVRALDEVCFDLREGEVHALVGENGAGKSTLMHILGGVYQADSGQVLIDGKPVRIDGTYDAARRGISIVFQELSLSENLSIAENIFANRQPTRLAGLVDWGELHSRARELLRRFEWGIDPETPVSKLSTAKRQVVEILKALARNPRVLVLDEPTSSLTASETELLFKNVRQLKDEGLSVIYISHRLGEVFELADRVTVLRDGRHVQTCMVSEVTEGDLVRKMVGRELADMYGSPSGAVGEERFRIDGASRADVFEGVSFSVREGEIIGIAGLAGAGRTELARGIFGCEPLDEGRMFVNGSPITARSPHEAIANRIAYLSEDRKADGLFLDLSIRDNCAAPSLRRLANRFGMMDEKAMTEFSAGFRERLGIVTPSDWQKVSLLSGGNQQKVLLAMWLGIQPKILIVDEPTRGVDVGAKSDIYHLLRGLAADGVAIIVISSDLPEILGLSDRVLVMRNGRLVSEFARTEATEEGIIASATGVSAPAGS